MRYPKTMTYSKLLCIITLALMSSCNYNTKSGQESLLEKAEQLEKEYEAFENASCEELVKKMTNKQEIVLFHNGIKIKTPKTFKATITQQSGKVTTITCGEDTSGTYYCEETFNAITLIIEEKNDDPVVYIKTVKFNDRNLDEKVNMRFADRPVRHNCSQTKNIGRVELAL